MPVSDYVRLASNIEAYNALISLERINKRLAVSQTRLSTGKRINSAADDPAGLCIANKFDARRNGIQTAIQCIGDGLNLLATAEGGASKIMDILIEMRSKTLMAASDTLGSEERAVISKQLNAYSLEIDDIVSQTGWNGNRLLDGLSQYDGQLHLLSGPDGEMITIDAASNNFGDLSVEDGALSHLRPYVANPNRAPVNNTPFIPSVAENGSAYIQGLGVTDPDAQTQSIQVTLRAGSGFLTLRTDVSNGLTASNIQNNSSREVTLSGTLDAINHTLASLHGVQYSASGANITSDTLTMVSNDLGNSGQIASVNQTTDSWNIKILPVNDSPYGYSTSRAVDENLRSLSAQGLAWPQTVAISPDNRFVYTSATADHTIGVYARDPSSGVLSLVETQSYPSGFGPSARIKVSADGKNVYTLNESPGSITVYNRDTVTGKLTGTGSVAAGSSITLFDMTVSADGKQVYAAGYNQSDGNGRIVTFDRNATTGALTQAGVVTSFGAAGPVQNPISIAISPDGNLVSVYGISSATQLVNGISTNTSTMHLGAFQRDPSTGALTPKSNLSSSVLYEAGFRTIDNLSSAPDTSTGLKSMYVTDYDRNTIQAFTYDPTSTNLQAVQTINNVYMPVNLHVSPDGQYAYVSTVDGIQKYNRDTSTGQLVGAPQTVVADPNGLPDALAMSPDGSTLVQTSIGLEANGALGTFQRNAANGQLTLQSIRMDTQGKTDYAVSELAGIGYDSDGPGHGIAVSGLSSPGQWQYSLDSGTTWLNFQGVAADNTTLLEASDRLRFIPPNGDWAGQAGITFNTWDQSDGYAGGTTGIDPAASTSNAFGGTITSTLYVNPVNDAPVIGNVTPFKLPVNTASSVAGLLTSASATDAESGTPSGIAVTGLETGSGTWQYSTNSGSSWNAFGAVSDTNATLLSSSDSVRFVADLETLNFRLWDCTNGHVSGDTNVDASLYAGVDLKNIPVNTPTTVGSLLPSVGAPAVPGLAVTGLQAGSGTWQYSTDGGGTWADFGSVSTLTATLLEADDLVKFTANPEAITFRAWDGSDHLSSGTTGVNVSQNGGSTAYSANSANVPSTSLTAPTLNSAAVNLMSDIREDAFNNTGTLISAFAGAAITTANLNAQTGIAVTGWDNSNGVWQYSTNGGSLWTNFSGTGATLLDAAARVRFQGNANYAGGSGNLTFSAWDQTDGYLSGTSGVTPGGNAYSAGSATTSLTVTALNESPVLSKQGSVSLTGISEDPQVNPGDLVSALLANGRFSDVDGATPGVAIIQADNTNGDWQFSTDSGLNWQNITATSDRSATVLDVSALLRFRPDANYNGSAVLNYRAWDQSDGLVSGAQGVDTTVNRGTGGAYSTYAETASIAIAPVNDTPTATGISLTASQDVSPGGRLPGMDVDGDVISYQMVNGPSSGSLSLNSNGTFQYQPNAGFYGVDQFTYQVNDGAVNSTAALVQITIPKPERRVVIASSQDANTYLGYLDDAIDKVSQRLNVIGNFSNKLLIREDVMMTSLIQTEAAYNRLMNADIAAEQMETTKNLLLQQTTIAMLAKSMRAPQYLSSLIQ